MSSQTIFAKLQEAAAYEAGWDRTTGNWATDQNNLFEVIKKDALSLFENPPPLPGERTSHQWSFLFPSATLELTPSYSTGTVTIVAGVVTLASGTFPSWAAQGDVWITDEDETRRYSVNTRDSGTQVTLDDTSVGVAAGATYVLRRHYYNLPSDFGGMFSEGFTYRRDSIYAGHVIKQGGPHDVRLYDASYFDGAPTCFTLEPIAITATASTTWKVGFSPLAGDTYFVDYRYRVVAADVDSTNDYPYGGAVHSETILAAVRYATAAKLMHPTADMRYAEFMRKLEMSVRFDRQNFKPIDYGVGRYGLATGYYERHAHMSIDDATFSFS